jgi:hypothetical protein
VPWRWYSFDPGTLRLADAHYLLGHHQRFGYFSKTGLPWRTVLDLTCNQKLPSFLEDAAAGALPPVSWIDPAWFCPQALHQPQSAGTRRAGLGLGPQYPGMRVAHASHLGELLTRSTPRPAPPRDALVQQAAARAAPAEPSQSGGHLPGPRDRPLNDLQKRILTATRELRKRGHPPNMP